MINKKKYFSFGLVIFLLAVLFFTFFSKTIYNSNLPSVTLSVPSTGELKYVVEGTSNVTYQNFCNIYGETNGRVRNILVAVGDKVKKGQTLMLLDADGEENQVEIKAPKDGIVTAVGINKDMYVMSAQNTILVQIAEVSNEWTVTLEVDPATANQITLDSQVSLNIKGFSKEVKASIKGVTSFAGKDGEKYSILIGFQCDDEQVVGKNADIVIQQKSQEYSTILPNYAINKDSKGYYVLVLMEKASILGNSYIASRVSVDLLETDNTHVAVMGLNPDMPVIASSTTEIKEGDRVKYEESGE